MSRSVSVPRSRRPGCHCPKARKRSAFRAGFARPLQGAPKSFHQIASLDLSGCGASDLFLGNRHEMADLDAEGTRDDAMHLWDQRGERRVIEGMRREEDSELIGRAVLVAKRRREDQTGLDAVDLDQA